MLRLLLATALIAAVPETCGLDRGVGPGQVNYLATLTVLNRTEAQVTVTSQARSFDVPACGEVTVDDFPINWWQLTSRGRDSLHSGGGHPERHSYVIVMGAVRQDAVRPDPLPECEGLLQGART